VRVRLLNASLGALAAAGLLAGCGGKGVSAPTTTRSTPSNLEHAAPDLEALLPDRTDGTPLVKGSTTGAVVFGGTAFGRIMTRFLRAHGKRPQDLRFANAQTASLEVGVFQVRGLGGVALRRAIVASSRPNAPGLTTAAATLSGKRVTRLVYPSGSSLYLYAHKDLVFYVGSQEEWLAAKILAMFP